MAKVTPKILLISDFHIGECLGSVRKSSAENYKELGPNCYVRKEFISLLNQLKSDYGITPENRLDYLVIMGDQWDLAVQPMPYSINLALNFFKCAKKNLCARNLIYLPGNHDHHIWRMVQTNCCVTEPLEKGKGTVDEFPQVANGVIDLSGGQFEIIGGKLIDKNLTKKFLQGMVADITDNVDIVYPNLYILYGKTSPRNAAICTHGHLFDGGWNPVTDVIYKFRKQPKQPFNLHDIEMLNSPITEFINYSMAQVGKYNMVDVLYDFYLILEGILPNWIKNLLRREQKLVQQGDVKIEQAAAFQGTKLLSMEGHLAEPLIDAAVKEYISEARGIFEDFLALDKPPETQTESKFLSKNRERVIHYINESVKDLKDDEIANFDKIIYGHTHIPENNTLFTPDDISQKKMDVFNTGGWVYITSKISHFPMPFLMFEDGEMRAVNVSS